jgi:riboflavin kinase/FMN adenylyltransferase
LDAVVFLEFTRAMSQLTPEEFLRLLRDRFGLAELVLGHDHGFGRGRSGNVQVVTALGRSMGFAVDVVDEVEVAGRPVSSTLIRRAVAGGDLDTAHEQLGRPYSCVGEVVSGAGRGTDLGYPTVNLQLQDHRKLLPPVGVYAVLAEWAGGRAGGMMHLGPRPTFDDASQSLEAHLFAEVGDLYGQQVKVSWIERLRDVQRFDGPEALKRQLDKDFADANTSLTGFEAPTNH